MAVDVGGKVTVDREDVEVAVDVNGKLTVDDKDYLIVRQVNHSEVWLLHMFIGLNHVIRVAYLLQHLR